VGSLEQFSRRSEQLGTRHHDGLVIDDRSCSGCTFYNAVKKQSPGAHGFWQLFCVFVQSIAYSNYQ
jgi:hypothetical protein